MITGNVNPKLCNITPSCFKFFFIFVLSTFIRGDQKSIYGTFAPDFYPLRAMWAVEAVEFDDCWQGGFLRC